MADDSLRKRARILVAARREFADRGLAGARTAHICREAGVNNQAIQGYYGSKEGLFDTILEQEKRAQSAFLAVPLTELAGGAGDLFDHLAARPDLVRLERWRILERPHHTMRHDRHRPAPVEPPSADRLRELVEMLEHLVHAWVPDIPDARCTSVPIIATRRRYVVAATDRLVEEFTEHSA